MNVNLEWTATAAAVVLGVNNTGGAGGSHGVAGLLEKLTPFRDRNKRHNARRFMPTLTRSLQ